MRGSLATGRLLLMPNDIFALRTDEDAPAA